MALIHSRNGQVLLDTTEVLVVVPIHRPNGNAFTLDETDSTYRCPIRDATVPVFYLTAGNPLSGDSFDAHFCPYAADEVHNVRVDGSRDYFFTTNLSGCNLGFGPLNPIDGSRLVGHANATTVGQMLAPYLQGDPDSLTKTRLVQQALQEHMLRSLEPASASLSPEDYGRASGSRQDINATVMGFRDTHTNKWTFIRQSYDAQQVVRRGH